MQHFIQYLCVRCIFVPIRLSQRWRLRKQLSTVGSKTAYYILTQNQYTSVTSHQLNSMLEVTMFLCNCKKKAHSYANELCTLAKELFMIIANDKYTISHLKPCFTVI